MKKIKYIFLAVIASIFFASCTSNEEILGEIEAIEQQATTDEYGQYAPDCPDEGDEKDS